MRLLELDIQRMPGFEKRGFAYQGLKTGIHVIWGPNGSGKTTTCKAIRALLWPQEEKNQHPILLRSKWDWHGEIIEIVREASKVIMPSSLADHLASVFPRAYTVVLDDLFNQQDRDLARIIAEEVRGGYNLEDLRERCLVPPKLGQQEVRDLGQLQRDLEQITREQGLLVEQEEGILQLRNKIEQAKKARGDLEQVGFAIEGKTLRNSIDGLSQQIAQVPPGVQEIRDEDEKELEALLIKQTSADFQEIDAEEARRCLGESVEWLEQIQNIDAQQKGREEEIEGLKEALLEHAKALNIEVDELLKLSTTEFQPSKKEASNQMIKEGKANLEEWLAIEKNHPLLFYLILSAGSAVLFALLFLEQSPLPTGLSAILALLAAFFFMRVFFERKRIVERYEQLRLPLPNPWRKKEVMAALQRIEELTGQNIDLHLWLGEVRQARETIVSLRRQEASYEVGIKKRDEAQKEFYHLLPSSLSAVTPGKALRFFQEMIDAQDHSLRKRRILLRTHCHSHDPLSEIREKRRMLKKYKELEEEKLRLEGRFEQILLMLKDVALLEIPLESLRNQYQMLEVAASTLDILQKEEGRIIHDVKHELTQRRFSEKSSELQEANREFQDKQHLWQEHLLAQFFLKEIEEQFEKEQRPEVIRIASRYFESFTLGLFSIAAVTRKENMHQFRIYDHKQEKQISLEALSQGTALQLHLSIRLAYLAAHEQPGLKLPLLLDELLSHVDDDRFLCIADALLEVAQERQIFLFTCQRATWHAWEKIAQEKGASHVHLIDLEELQSDGQRQRVPIILPEKKTTVRQPHEQENISDYAFSLGLAGLDPQVQLLEQPTWLVFSTSQDLFKGLTLGRKNIGQLKQLLQQQPQLFSDSATILKKMDLLERYLHLRKIGDPLCVWRDDLEKAVAQGIFSETFLDAVDACASSVERKADRLLEKLKTKGVKRFQKIYIEQLEEFLLQEGLLDLRSSLTDEEMRRELWNHDSSPNPQTAEYIEYLLSLFIADKLLVMSSIDPSS